MGGLYNLLHGVQQDMPVLIRMLEIHYTPGLRLRDAWLNPDGTRIIVLTRNGGGNRQHSDPVCKENGPCLCIGCVIKYLIPKHPLYVRDWDDDYDSTYAYIEFTVPPEFADWCRKLATGKEMPSLKERFDGVLKELESMPREQAANDPRVKPILDQIKKVIGK